MRSTAIDRRRALALAAGFAAWPLAGARAGAPAPAPRFLTAGGDKGGRFLSSGLAADGTTAFELALPGRGHGFAVHPRRPLAVQFARRPGHFAVVIDTALGRAVGRIERPPEKHFFGHGVFSPDGRLLYASENDAEAERGVIGVYDVAAGFARVGEWPSHELDPHQVVLLPDGVTLAVAQGGILTRPDLPRMKLNLPTMRPALTYIDRRDGRLVREVRLPAELHQLSIHHLAVGRGGLVALAMQYEGPAGDLVPLVATDDGRGPPRLFEGPARVLRTLKNYCGSVAFDATGEVLAVSSPRGGTVAFWEAAEARPLASFELPDGCGVAPFDGPGAFLVSSGRGDLFRVDGPTGKAQRLAAPAARQWDNHLAVLPA